LEIAPFDKAHYVWPFWYNTGIWHDVTDGVTDRHDDSIYALA